MLIARVVLKSQIRQSYLAALATKRMTRPKHRVPATSAKLRRRITETQWPEKETVADSSQGVPLATMQELARYWATDYDWRKAELKLNAFSQFVTNIDGLDIHFIHVRSREQNALPLIINHGWPGSVLEQIKLIGPLTDPVAHGGKALPEDTLPPVSIKMQRLEWCSQVAQKMRGCT